MSRTLTLTALALFFAAAGACIAGDEDGALVPVPDSGDGAVDLVIEVCPPPDPRPRYDREPPDTVTDETPQAPRSAAIASITVDETDRLVLATLDLDGDGEPDAACTYDYLREDQVVVTVYVSGDGRPDGRVTFSLSDPPARASTR